MDIQPQAFCRPCNSPMQKIVDEAMGQTYQCPECKRTVELSNSRPILTIDVVGDPKKNGDGGVNDHGLS